MVTAAARDILDDLDASGGPPAIRDAGAAQIAALRDAVLADLFLFATVIFGYKDLADVHRDIAALLGVWGQPGYRRLMVQIPRGHFKTSICTIANSLWQVCREPDAPLAIFNEKEDNAAMWVRAIRETVQNSVVFQTLFPELLPPGIHIRDRDRGVTLPRSWKWTDTELLFQRGSYGIPEPSIMGLGIGSASAGRHWPKIIKDDVISEDAKNSPLVMERARDWADHSFSLEQPALGGMDLFACTPWHYSDVYAHVLSRYGYKLFRRSAFNDDGSVLFPEKFERATLEAMQRSDPYSFSSQFMCKPRPGKEIAFEYEWLRFGAVRGDTFVIEDASFNPSINPAGVPEKPTRAVPLAAMEKCILVDPIPDGETERRLEPGCRHAVVPLGRDYFGRRFFLPGMWAGRCDPLDLINIILDLCGALSCDRVGIEKVAFSVVYRHWLREESRRRSIPHLTLIDLEPGRRQKDARIRAKIAPTRQGIYYVDRGVEREFVREYLEYPYGTTRDILDAWAYDDEAGILPRPLSPEEQQRYDDLHDARTRHRLGCDEITGY